MTASVSGVSQIIWSYNKNVKIFDDTPFQWRNWPSEWANVKSKYANRRLIYTTLFSMDIVMFAIYVIRCQILHDFDLDHFNGQRSNLNMISQRVTPFNDTTVMFVLSFTVWNVNILKIQYTTFHLLSIVTNVFAVTVCEIFLNYELPNVLR